MPIVTKYICDGCGKEKGATNHWFRVRNFKLSNVVTTWEVGELGEMCCGEACVLAAISKWMQERKDKDTDIGKG